MLHAVRSIRTSSPTCRDLKSQWDKRLVRALLTFAPWLIPTAAQGDPVVFVNPPDPGHYILYAPIGTTRSLNLKLPANAQLPPLSPLTPGIFRQSWDSPERAALWGGVSQSSNRLAVDQLDPPPVSNFTPPYNALHMFQFGDAIGITLPGPASVYFTSGHVCSNYPEAPPQYCVADVDQPRYVGVRFDSGTGIQYGWIGVVRNSTSGLAFDAFAWGYETTPGVPITAGAGLGACCSGGQCIFTNAAACGAGSFTAGQLCEPATCTIGACCVTGQCFVHAGSTACENDGGTYLGNNTTCSADPLNPTTCCPANINGESGLTVQDIFDFLAAYFGNLPAGDFNGVGGHSVQDVFDFLAAYFGGC